MQCSRVTSAWIALGLSVAAAGCTSLGGAASKSDAALADAPAAQPSDPRAAAAGDYPPVFGNRAPAAEPKTPAELAAVERELSALGEAQRAASGPAEVASLRRRARELERLRDALRGTMEAEGPAGAPFP